MAQGWHLGLDASDEATLTFLYRVDGPRGILPPFFSDLGPWVLFGEIGC